MGSWIEPPHEGEVWRRRGPPQETRHVYDRTLGGDVCYYDGDWRRRFRRQCSFDDWYRWAAHARRVE